MSKCINLGTLKDDIYFLEDECNHLHYKFYVCYCQKKLYNYDVTFHELDKAYYELEISRHEYKVEYNTKEERCERDQRSMKYLYLNFFNKMMNHIWRLKQIIKGDNVTPQFHIEEI